MEISTFMLDAECLEFTVKICLVKIVDFERHLKFATGSRFEKLFVMEPNCL
jgi:hypothetical protein